MQLLIFFFINSVNAVCEGAQCCEHGEWWSNKQGCEQEALKGKCGGCYAFHVDPKPAGENDFCCDRRHRQLSEEKPAVVKTVEAKPEVVERKSNQTCDEHCTAYMTDAFKHGITEDDYSRWCTSELDLCYSGNCMSDCKFNLVELKGYTRLNCNKVCEGAWPMGSIAEEQNAVVSEQKPEVQAGSGAVCEGAQCCEHGEWWSNKQGCEQEALKGKCGGCYAFHVDPKPAGENDYCCDRRHRQLSEEKPAVVKTVEAKPEVVERKSNEICADHCTAYMTDAFKHGITEDDYSRWCTSELDLCHSGNCMSDCKFNLVEGRGYTRLNCNKVCEGAMGSIAPVLI